MNEGANEERLLRAVTLQNARAVLLARERAEQSLREANAELSRRLAELQQATAEIQESRRAALNLMEDAVEAQNATEKLNTALRESEERFRTMADNISQLAWTCDALGHVTWYNQRWLDYTGMTFEDMKGWGWKRCHHPDHVDRVVKRVEHSRDTGELWEDTFPLRGRDGNYRWFLSRAVPIRDEQGRIVRWFGTNTDVTGQRAGEQARAQLAAIVESSEDAIISKDLNGVITSWNRGAEQLFGYTSQEAVGQPVTMLIPPDHLSEEPGILERIRRGEAIGHYETVRRRKDGSLLDISLTVSPIRDSAGQIIGASKIARDISHRKRNEEALRRAQEELADRAGQLEQAVRARTAELRETNEQLEAFVYSIAHDLRAPLRSMTGFSQLLLDDHAAGLDESARNLLKRIYASSAFMDKLLLDLLAFGRAGRTEVDLGPVEVRKAWEAALFQTSNQAEQAGARIEVIGPLPRVQAHEATLGQCLANLLSNAMKFVAPGVQPHIRFWAEESNAPLKPTLDRPLSRPSGTLSPSEGERDGERGPFNSVPQQPVTGQGWGEEAPKPPEPGPSAHGVRRHDSALAAPGMGPAATDNPTAQEKRSHASAVHSVGLPVHGQGRGEEAPVPTGQVSGSLVRLWVEDNGIGIAPEHQERAFRVFERLNGARYAGTGIGLSIVRKGIERMGGKVGLESEPGKGTRFWIELAKAD